MARKYIRMNSRRKARVEKILEGLGLTPSQAVNLFFAQIERRKAIPFALAWMTAPTFSRRLSKSPRFGMAWTARIFPISIRAGQD